jgi:indole-3-glycerol phosphate synthase
MLPLPHILDRIRQHKLAERAERSVPLSALRAAAEQMAPPRDARGALRRPAGARVRVIAEFKRRSPSAGWLQREADAAAIGRAYARAGAAMISVLTDGRFFGGSLADLTAVQDAVPVPVLRKDFLLDDYDVYAARCAGASCVLLIARLFPDAGALRALIDQSRALGMEPLVEAHTVAEAAACRDAGAHLIGINHRDLDTLTMDLSLSQGLRAALGRGPVLVAESGLGSGADLLEMERRGMDAVLIGEALLRGPDPGAGLARLLDELTAVSPLQSAGEGSGVRR